MSCRTRACCKDEVLGVGMTMLMLDAIGSQDKVFVFRVKELNYRARCGLEPFRGWRCAVSNHNRFYPSD